MACGHIHDIILVVKTPVGRSGLDSGTSVVSRERFTVRIADYGIDRQLGLAAGLELE